jgi:hypothetical protein
MDMDYQGLSGVGRGVYSPYFLMEGLAMAQTVQDLIYLLNLVEASIKKNSFVVLPIFFSMPKCMLFDCNELPK